jgi:hypothetical protein
VRNELAAAVLVSLSCPLQGFGVERDVGIGFFLVDDVSGRDGG